MLQQSSFSERLRFLMKENNISPNELVKKIPTNLSSLYRYLDGSGLPKYETLYALSQAFDVSVDYLMGFTSCKDILHVHEPILEVPVLKGFKAKDNILDEKNIERYLTIPKDRFEHSQNLFAMRINDDVMRPRFYEGDIVIVERNAPINDGDLGVFIIGEQDACIREYLSAGNNGWLLNRFNPLKPPKYYSLDDIQQKPILYIGKVVESITFFE